MGFGGISPWSIIIITAIIFLIAIPFSKKIKKFFEKESNEPINIYIDGKLSNVNKHLAASIHNGTIDANEVIDRYEENYKANSFELGVDLDYLYEEANKENKRERTRKFLLLIPICFALYSIINTRDESLFLYIILSIIIASLINIYFEYSTLNYIRKIMKEDAKYEEKEQNVVIYSGYYPFQGLGTEINSWSIAVDIKKCKDGSTIEEIEVHDILSKIEDKIYSEINNATISDKLFINGRDVESLDYILEQRGEKPKTKISNELIKSHEGINNKRVNHFKVINTPVWGNQMYLNSLVRLVRTESTLYIEVFHLALGPISKKHMDIDKYFIKMYFLDHIRIFFAILFKSMFSWVSSLFLILKNISDIYEVMKDAIFGEPELNKIMAGANYDYGFKSSLREKWQTKNYQRYYQMLDKEKNHKIIQYSILNSITKYLDEKGISTEDFKDSSTTIINSGIMVSGGDVNAKQMAVGEKSNIKNKGK